LNNGAQPQDIVVRFIPFQWTTPAGSGRRVSSGAFYSVSGTGRGFSVWFKAGTDIEGLLLQPEFLGAGVVEISVPALEALGFTITRSPPPLNLQGDHANVVPPPDWTDSKYQKQAKRIVQIAMIVRMPLEP
jgi:hypothetical protein